VAGTWGKTRVQTSNLGYDETPLAMLAQGTPAAGRMYNGGNCGQTNGGG